jgi:hypothetical protein
MVEALLIAPTPRRTGPHFSLAPPAHGHQQGRSWWGWCGCYTIAAMKGYVLSDSLRARFVAGQRRSMRASDAG